MSFRHAADQREQQSKGVIGHRVIGHARGVGDNDAAPGGRGDINGIITDAPAGNKFEAVGGGRFKDSGRVVVHAGEHGVGSVEQIKKRSSAETELRLEHSLAPGVLQYFDGAPADFFHGQRRNEDLP